METEKTKTSKYAYIISANERYLTPLNILLNSLEFVKNTQDVHLVSWNLPQAYLDKLSQLGYRVIVHEMSGDEKMQALGEGNVLMRYRYFLAGTLKEYSAVCMLDADTMICRNLDLWLEIADKAKVILGCSMEQKRWYGEPEEHHKVNGEYPIPRTWAEKDICCSPLFLCPSTHGDAMVYSWHIFADYSPELRFLGPDMDSQNLALIKFGYTDRIIDLAEATWSGLHETLLKPFSHISEMHSKLWTINGEPVYLIHGQYMNPVWRQWQIDGQIGCIDRELDGSPRNKQIAQQCLDFITQKFEEMNNFKIKWNEKSSPV